MGARCSTWNTVQRPVEEFGEPSSPLPIAFSKNGTLNGPGAFASYKSQSLPGDLKTIRRDSTP